MSDPAEAENEGPAGDTEKRDANGQAAGLTYRDVHAFVQEWFTVKISRPLGGTHRWCPEWWAHPEAELRLDALWRAYEHLQGDPDLGPITFLTHHLDPTLQVLLSPSGPFARCTPERHEVHQPLPVNPQLGGGHRTIEAPTPVTSACDLPRSPTPGAAGYRSGPRGAPPSAPSPAEPVPGP